MLDQYSRKINYLRISITDRCNLRCCYCMPQGIKQVKHEQIISYEDIVAFVKLVSELGIDTIKITGGEPLVRKDCCSLIKKLKQLPKIKCVTLTTNGILLKKYLPELLEAKVDAINISLDTLDPKRYKAITGFDCLSRVLEGIKAAMPTSLKIKVNCVAFKGNNDWQEIIKLAKQYPIDVRFIEMMPIGLGKKYETLNNLELIKQLKATYPKVTKDDSIHGNGPAYYYQIEGFLGSVGFIGAIHDNFCHQCNRIRLTSKGYLKCCLCYDYGKNILEILHKDISKEDKIDIFKNIIYKKPKEHCFLEEEKITENKMMSAIGG